MAGKSKVLLVGISGPSSSGKTTLARLLRQVWPGSFVIHEDDFYWADSLIPTRDGLQDWDSLQSLDLLKLQTALQHIKAKGYPPPELQSKEDQNTAGEVSVDNSVLDDWTRKIKQLFEERGTTTVVFIDGFLLYSQQMKPIRDLFDVKLFLWSDYQTTKARREARNGYVTLDGFWEDPPEYVDKIVWPNYVNEHAFLFQNGDVEQDYDMQACSEAGVEPVPRDLVKDMTSCVQWACNVTVEPIVKFHQ